MLLPATTVPANQREILVRIGRKPKCVHCGKPLFQMRTKNRTVPPIEADRNGLGELIAWCNCHHCGKISALMLK